MRLLRLDYYDNDEAVEEYINDVVNLAVQYSWRGDSLQIAVRAYIVPKLQEKANTCGIGLAAEGHTCSGDIIFVRLPRPSAFNRR